MKAFSPIHFRERLFSGAATFDALRDELWVWQRAHTPMLRAYCEALGRADLTYLPIEFFKYAAIQSAPPWQAALQFESSGTTGQEPSRHLVRDPDLYRESAIRGFFHFFPEKPYRILALLPSYLERKNASLVHMVQLWMDTFGTPGSGFFLHDFDALARSIETAAAADEQILLIGVSFALLDFAAFNEKKGSPLPPDALVMETGGMKGRREELTRDELHAQLQQGLGISPIASEYGMTELLSQAYAREKGRFYCPPWMRVEVADMHLPTLLQPTGVSGRILITDLSNVHSCAFIATDDIGRMHEDGSFEILGRLDHAEMRGCSLMYQ